MRYRDSADADTKVIALDADQRARHRRLLDGVVASVHDHPVRLPEPLTRENWARHADLHEDVLAETELDRSSLDLVFVSALSEPNLDHVLHWAEAMNRVVSTPISALKRQRTIVRGLDDLDFTRLQLSIVLALEDLVSMGDDLNNLDLIFDAGIRSAGISYNAGSALGGGLAETDDAGLTMIGRQAVTMMNDLGMAIDISHAGDRTGMQTVDASSAPVLITHAGARAVWASDRMKPDAVIRAVSGGGGLIGIEAAPGSTRTRLDSSQHDIDDVVRHIEYCAELVGVEHVALGPDTFYGDHVQLYEAAGWAARPMVGVPELNISEVAGADNPSEVPRQVAAALIMRGWSDSDIAKILGENALRVTREIVKLCPAS